MADSESEAGSDSESAAQADGASESSADFPPCSESVRGFLSQLDESVLLQCDNGETLVVLCSFFLDADQGRDCRNLWELLDLQIQYRDEARDILGRWRSNGIGLPAWTAAFFARMKSVNCCTRWNHTAGYGCNPAMRCRFEHILDRKSVV